LGAVFLRWLSGFCRAWARRTGVRRVLPAACFVVLVTMVVGMAGSGHAGDDPRLPRLLVLGDSLVAGHGLAQGDAFPDRLAAVLATRGRPVEIINAGVSGDTTAGGLARLDWSLADDPDAVIIVLGGNDLLRGLEPDATKANLAAIIDRLQQREIDVLLAGMQAPRNLGRDYAGEFDAIYRTLGGRDDVLFYPFFLDGVALEPALNQTDGMHPNRAGVDEIVRRILPMVERLLDHLGAR